MISPHLVQNISLINRVPTVKAYAEAHLSVSVPTASNLVHFFCTWLCVNASLCALCVVVCQHCHFPKSLLDIPTMASLYVLSCAMITRCLSLCVCVCVRVNVFVHSSIKKSHCATTARLVLSCFREEGKTGRIRGDMSIGRGRTSFRIHTSYMLIMC